MPQPRVGVAIITYRARDLLRDCVEPLLASPLKPRILVVNSSSKDGTVELAHEFGVEVLVIPREEFNHGITREMARRHLGTEIVVMLTPDAHAIDSVFLERLTAPLMNGRASVAYARQLARPGADPIESFNRHFNYPAQSAIRGGDAYKLTGNQAHFCSNSAAAWLTSALDEVGGFEAALVSEDTVACARLLRRGHKIAYVANATVIRSYPSSIVRDFRRQFDIGYGRSQHIQLLLGHGPDEKRGLAYASKLIERLWQRHPAWLVPGVANLLARYAGYRLGMIGHYLPSSIRARLSAQDLFWTERFSPSRRAPLRRAA